MYTGIVEQTGTIISLLDSSDGHRLEIQFSNSMPDLKLGESININGCCFTVIEFSEQKFSVQASHETLRRSSLGILKTGDLVNLERPLMLADRVGGHLVAGHVDTTAKVSAIKKEGFSNLITFSLSAEYLPYFVEKGSVTVDGVSLTVVGVKPVNDCFEFSVALIPYTMQVTTLKNLQIGQIVNIETDLVAKYLAHWCALGNQIGMTKLFESLKTGNLPEKDLVY